MGMGSLSDSEDDFNPEINTTPLVDVMLVLLIIFMITIPVMNNNVAVNLPQAATKSNPIKPDSISLSINADGQLYWNSEKITDKQMSERMSSVASQEPQPELHLRAERTTEYEKVAQVMAAAQSSGLSKIGFITEPVAK